MLVVKFLYKKYTRCMNQTVLSPNIATQDETNYTNKTPRYTVDVYSASITIHSDDIVMIRPNVIDTNRLVSQKPEFTSSVPEPIKSQHQTVIETQKRIQTLRAQSILQNHNSSKRKARFKSSSDNWKLIVGYTIAILLAVLLLIPFVNHVATALAAF